MPNKKITIIDYGCGNILNLIRAITFLGYEAEATNDKKKIIASLNTHFSNVFTTAQDVLNSSYKFLDCSNNF